MATAKTKTVALPAIIDLDALDAVRDTLAEAIDQGATAEQLEVIAALDPHNVRAAVIKDNPPARRAA